MPTEYIVPTCKSTEPVGFTPRRVLSARTLDLERLDEDRLHSATQHGTQQWNHAQWASNDGRLSITWATTYYGTQKAPTYMLASSAASGLVPIEFSTNFQTIQSYSSVYNTLTPTQSSSTSTNSSRTGSWMNRQTPLFQNPHSPNRPSKTSRQPMKTTRHRQAQSSSADSTGQHPVNGSRHYYGLPLKTSHRP